MNESLRRSQEQNDAMAASEGKQLDGEEAEGAGTPEGGPETGTSGVTRLSAGPGETGGYGADVRPGGLTGGHGTGGVTPEEQAEEGNA